MSWPGRSDSRVFYVPLRSIRLTAKGMALNLAVTRTLANSPLSYNAVEFQPLDIRKDILKYSFLTAVLALSLTACASHARNQNAGETAAGHSDSEHEPALMSPEQEPAALHKDDPTGSYGEPLQADVFGSIGELLAQAEANEGKVVRVSGVVAHVCPMRGCWVDIADEEGKAIQIKVVDGTIVFPLSAEGYTADVRARWPS